MFADLDALDLDGPRLLVLAAQGAVSAGLAWMLSLYATPLARDAARRFGIVDAPDGRLKTHAEPIPYLGGLAVYGAFLLALALSFTLGFDRRVLGLLLGGSVLVIVGLIDDLGSLPYGAKMVGELVAALVAVRSGIVVELHFWGDGLAAMAINGLASVFWLVLATNALNLVDIMDGLAASLSIVAALFFALVALLNGRVEVLCATAALAGALLGFRRHNRYPATIYLGDAGALFVGFMLGALGLIGSYTMVNRLGFVTPLLILGVPIFDTLFVSVVRLMRGASPFLGSPDHFPLRLRRRGMEVPRVVGLATVAGMVLGLAGLLNVILSLRAAAVVLAVVAVAGVAATLALVERRAPGSADG